MIIVNANVVDAVHEVIHERRTIRVQEDRIVDVGDGSTRPSDGEDVIDAEGRFVLPGLIDAHSHIGSVASPEQIMSLPPAVYVAEVFAEMTAALRRGFTTTREAGFTDASFEKVRKSGAVKGPRMFCSNGAISITGGHCDVRSADDEVDQPVTWNGLYWPGLVVDGVGKARWAAREALRRGATQLKVMAGGGCSTENDGVHDIQFSPEELSAIVQEARSRSTYVLAHALSPEAITHAVQAGVGSIEHGNLLDERSAALMAQGSVALVPTIGAYQTRLLDENKKHLPDYFVRKLSSVLAPAYEAAKIAQAAGLVVGLGTDLSGRMQSSRAMELVYHARALDAFAAIRAATHNNARIMRISDEIGLLETGYIADMIIVDGDPTANIEVLADENNIKWVVQAGKVAKSPTN